MEKFQKVTKELLETLDAIQIYGGATEYGTDATYQGCNEVCDCNQNNCSDFLCQYLHAACNYKPFLQCGGGLYNMCS